MNEDLMSLIDAYAESRHVNGHRTYSQKTAEARKAVVDAISCLEAAAVPAGEVKQAAQCWCTTCRPITMDDMRFVVCPECGNKRCPRAHNHALDCTHSNAPGQPGSSWEHVKPSTTPGG